MSSRSNLSDRLNGCRSPFGIGAILIVTRSAPQRGNYRSMIRAQPFCRRAGNFKCFESDCVLGLGLIMPFWLGVDDHLRSRKFGHELGLKLVHCRMHFAEGLVGVDPDVKLDEIMRP